MNELILHFGSSNLFRVEFQHDKLAARIVSMRGKETRRADVAATFQWTTAVKALALIFLRAATHSIDDAKLTGERGSLAASLDYALGRKPIWIKEMFGRSKSNNLMISLLFERSNPELRTPGPTSVCLRRSAWKNINIKIYRDSNLIRERSELSRMLLEFGDHKEISHGSQISVATPAQLPIDCQVSKLKELIRPGYHEEVKRSLNSFDAFSQNSLKANVSELLSNPSFTSRIGSRRDDFAALIKPQDTTSRLGLDAYDEKLLNTVRNAGELSIVAPIVFPGTLAIFTYLKYWRDLPINILDQFPHAVEVSARLAKGQFLNLPDLVTMGLGPASTLMNCSVGTEYSPYLVLPQGKMSLLRPSRSGKIKRFHFLHDEPSSPSFLYEHLVRDFASKADGVHADVDEAIARLRDGEDGDGAILMFPYNFLAKKIHGANEITTPHGSTPAHYILFATKRLLADPVSKALEVLIRDAWLTLLESDNLRTAVVDKLLANDRHLRVMLRSAGVLRLVTPKFL